MLGVSRQNKCKVVVCEELLTAHCRPVSSSTADMKITTTSARNCAELASTTGAICDQQ